MPNWCYNSLSISGSQDALERFHADRKTALEFVGCEPDQVITFNQFLPMPKELIGTDKVYTHFTETEVRELAVKNGWSDQVLQDALKNVKTPEVVAESKRLIEKYGSDNWYDWRIANWDTKWDACRSDMIDPNHFAFETAWCPPTKVIREMASSYPELRFTHSYSLECEEGEWDFTYFTEDGELMIEWEHQSRSSSGGAVPADEVDEHSIP